MARRAERQDRTPAAAGDTPLTDGQRALWFLDRLAPAAAAYNLPSVLRLPGPLDLAAFRRAAAALTRRHPALATRFRTEGGVPRARVDPALETDFEEADAARWSAAARGAWLERESYRPFDLESGPLLRLRLLATANGDHLLLIVAHHLVADFWSLALLVHELGRLYEAERDGTPPPPRPERSYADFAAWQARRLEEEGEALERWWRDYLAGAPQVLEVPTDRPRPPVQSWAGGSRVRRLDAALARRAGAFGRRRRAPLYAVLLAAFQALLGRWTGRDELLVGSPTAGRPSREWAGVMGYFVNPVVVRGDLAGAPGFGELVERTRELSGGALGHAGLPFPRVVEALRPQVDPSRQPLFQVLFSLQKVGGGRGLEPFALGLAGGRATLGALEMESVAREELRSQFDLSLLTGRLPGGEIGAVLVFNRDLYDPATAERLVAGFATLLEAALAEPERRIDELPLLAAAEEQQVRLDWNRAGDLDPAPARLDELVVRQARRTPDRVALADTGRAWSYRHLVARAGELAAVLEGVGVGSEVRVAVHLARGPELVATLLGVIAAGGAYVPLDPSLPAERRALLADDSGAAVVVARERGVPLPPAVATGRRVIDLDRLPAAATDGRDGAADPPASGRSADALAYLIYTSGSTGRPKAVALAHRSAAALVAWARRTYSADELSGVLAATSIGFDLSVFELFAPLATGGTVILAEDALALAGLPAAARVTLVNTVPSAMVELLRLRAIPPSVVTVNLAGEPLRRALADQVFRAAAVERLWNLYGPSEDTTYSTAERVERSVDEPSIGRPIDGTSAYVADPRGALVPVGVPGELLLAGAGLARGYLGRPARTAGSFVPDPFGGRPGGRLYRTGDLARWRPDGRLEFLGRLDHQVKLRGFRIELGEIEAALAERPEVAAAVVAVHRDRAGERRLAAWVVPTAAGRLDAETLRRALAERLPDYMVPRAVVVMAELPRTATGKVDRRALPAPEPTTGPAAGEPPATPLEEVLCGVWAEVLGLEAAGATDDFFAVGGHSLLAARALARVRDRLGVDPGLSVFFQAPTPRALAERVATMRRASRGAPAAPPLEPRFDPAAPAPLSFAQQRLWFLDRLEPGNPFYNVPAAFRAEGPLVPALLAAALGALVERHRVLASSIRDVGGEPLQLPAPEVAVPLPVVDLGGLPADRRWLELARLAREEAVRPFDLARPPLLRALLVREADARHAVLLTLHHAASDGWSLGVLIEELAELYPALAEGRAPALAELPVQYADYAVWQRRWLRGEVLAAELAHWRERLAGAPPLLELPADRPRPPVASYRGHTTPVAVSPALTRRLAELARTRGATLFMVLLAAFQVLLARLSGQPDVMVGTPVANRGRQELEGLIGFFANTLVLRGRVEAERSFGERIERVRAATLEAYDHQELPFEKLVEELQPERNRAHAPLFQVLFVLQNAPLGPVAIPGLELTPLAVDTGSAKFDLTLSLAERPPGADPGEEHGLCGWVEAASDLFDRTTIRRLVGSFETLLEAAVAAPERPVAALDLLAPAARQQVVVEWRGGAGPPRLVRLERTVRERAAAWPDRIAVVYRDRHVTYGELGRRAASLAVELRRLGVGPDVRVALALGRSERMTEAVLAVLEAGGAYVPLDPAHPRRRLAMMIEDSRAQALLTEAAVADRLPAAPGIPVVRLDAPGVGRSHEAATAEAPPAGSLDDLFYVVFTSGSTGRPKGVALPHRALSNLVDWHLGRLAGGVRTLQLASLGFDVSAMEMFVAWCSGGTLLVADEALRRDPAALARHLARERVEKAVFPVVLFEGVAEEVASWPDAATALAPLAEVTTTGEQMQATPRVVELFERLPGASFHNHYGPSETHVATAWPLPPRPSSWPPKPPIGRPIADVDARVLDPSMRPLPIGAPGELFLGGAALARGYLGRPALTAERFVPDPFGPPGARLYATGDRARAEADGVLRYLGRLDHQVKLRGFRVEPGEVEAALVARPSVAEAFVMLREDVPGDRRLVAYVVPERREGEEPAAALDPRALREAIARTLPAYMIPAAFVALEALPLTPNRKVDRRALPAPEVEGRGGEEPPAGPLEELVAGVWADLLGAERIGRHDDFFDLGGHSLLATRLVSRLGDACGAEVPLAAVFDRPTVAGLAETVAEARRSAGGVALPPPVEPLPPERRHRPLPLAPAQERLWLADRLEPGNPVFNLFQVAAVDGPLVVPALAAAFATIVARHEALRTRFVEIGGVPHQEIAPRLDHPLPVVDLSGLPPAAGEAAADALARAEAVRPFDLARGPLLRTALLRLGPSRHRLLTTLHHIAGDDASIGALLGELRELYAAGVEGRAARLPELPVQYADYASWHRRHLTDESLAGQIDHWRRELAGELPVLELAAGRPRPPRARFRGASAPVRLAPERVAAMRRLGRATGLTPFMTLLAAFAAVLARHSGQDDLVIGGAVANRRRPEIEPLIGFFVNVLPLRIDLSGEPTWRETLERVRRTCLAAYDHQDVPFEKLVEVLQPKRDLSRTPIRQAGLSFLDTPRVALELAGGVTVTPLPFESGTSPLDVTLIVWHEPDGAIAGTCEYNVDLLDRPMAERLVAGLDVALAAMTADADGRRPAELAGELPPLVEPTASPPLPLTDNQSLYWFAERLQEDFYYAYVRTTFEISGALDPDRFARAFERAVAASDSLRSVLEEVDGVPLRRVLDRPPRPLERFDLSGRPDPERAFASWLAERTARRLDLAERTYDSALVELGPERWTWYLSVHHAVIDALSLGVLFRYLATAYRAAGEAGGEGAAAALAELPDLPSYAEYLAHERAYKASRRHERAERYWRRKLALDVDPVPFYRSARADADAEATSAVRVSLPLGAERSERLRAFSSRHGLFSVAMTPLAVLFAYLARLTGHGRLRIGTTFANRFEAFREQVGLLINNCPVQLELGGGETLVEVARKTQAEYLDTSRHQQYPVRNFHRDRTHDVYFNHNAAEMGDFCGLPVTFDLLFSGRTNNLLDVQLRDFDRTGAWVLDFDFNDVAFEPADRERTLGHYLQLFDALLAAPETPLATAPLLTPAERLELVGPLAGRRPQPASADTLDRRFAARVAERPDAVAVTCDGEQLTYDALARRAHRLARCLRDLGVGPETPVGVAMERSLALVVALLGVVEAGGAYVPLDPAYPADRLAHMLTDAGVRIVLTEERLLDRLPTLEEGGEEVSLLCLDADWEALAAEYDDAPLPPAPVGAERLAYVIYTSGSTGRPKGSPISHANVVRLLDATEAWFGFGPDDVWTLFHSYAFDFSVWELWGALAYGGRLVVVPFFTGRSPEAFHRLLAAERATVLNQTPSAFRQLVEADRAAPAERLALDWVIFGGEALELQSLEPWLARHGDRRPRLVNMYGITETTVHVTFRPLAAADLGRRGSPVGEPIPDLGLYLLDRAGELVPLGVPGEIHVAGAGLGRGYLGRAALTAERFVPNPFGGPGERLYRSGDLAARGPGGDLDFLGRIDHQVKIRGFRIELGEIESALAAHPGVASCLVVAREDRPGDRRLVAYLVAREATAGPAPAAAELRRLAGRQLPDYMVPSAFVLLEELPLTPSGKVDRRALPAPDEAPRTATAVPEAASGVAPGARTATEEVLADLWREVLGVGEVPAGADFFELGGHSLLATQVISRLREALGVDLPLRSLFETPTLEAFAARVDAERAASPETPTPAPASSRATTPPPIPRLARPAEADGGELELPATFAQERLWRLARREPRLAAYAVAAGHRLRGSLKPARLASALGAVAARHEALRTRLAARSEAAGSARRQRVVQRIAAPAPLPLPVVDLSRLPADRRGEALERCRRAEAVTPFDLGRGPLTRARLLRLDEEDHVLTLTLHHAVGDGWSMRLVVQELLALYAGAELAPPVLQLADIAGWQRRVDETPESRAELADWRRALAGLRWTLELPADRPPAGDGPRGPRAAGRVTVPLAAPLEPAVAAVARAHGATRFAVYLAGWVALLGRLSGAGDLAVGTPVARRERPELEGVVGWLVDLPAVRTDLGGNPSFAVLIERTREAATATLERRRVPFARVADALGPAGEGEPPPRLQAFFMLEEEPPASTSAAPAGLEVEPLPPLPGLAAFDLALAIAPGGSAATLEYDATRFAPATATRIVHLYRSLLAAALAAPAIPVAALRPVERGADGDSPPGPAASPPTSRPGGLVPLVKAPGPDASPPLFLVHAVGGGVGCYLELVRRLEEAAARVVDDGLHGSPAAGATPLGAVWGLQAPALARDAEAADVGTLEELAERHLEAVRSIAPAGPYRLAGWSMGGAVAFEMARRLSAAGEQVELLALFDTHLPSAARAAGAGEPDELALSFAFDLVGGRTDRLAAAGGPTTREAFLALDAEGRRAALARLAEVAGVLPRGTGDERVRRLEEVHTAHTRAFLDYRPRPWPGRLELFRAADGARRAAAGGEDAVAGWAALATGGAHVEEVPGDHHSLLRGEGARRLAARLVHLLTPRPPAPPAAATPRPWSTQPTEEVIEGAPSDE